MAQRNPLRNREWWEKARIGKKNDKRRKLSEEDKETIRKLYYEDGCAIREIARMGFCSRKMVQFILFPERRKRNKERFKEEKRWQRYYSTARKREDMRKHRERLKKLKTPH